MQTLHEIRRLLSQAGLAPRKQFGQCFLIDGNLMRKLLELAEVPPGRTVLEVGPGTGSLTEALLERPGRTVAVEIDHGLAALLRRRLGGRENLSLIEGDVLAGKHALSDDVLAALGGEAHLVANLPYSVATPIVSECLLSSRRSLEGRGVRFDRLTFMVQAEVADRMHAEPGSDSYGAVSVLVALLGRVTMGPAVPAGAFWPRPKVASRMVRIDFDEPAAAQLRSAAVLVRALALAFGQRRKQIHSVAKRRGAAFTPDLFAEALAAAGIDPALRAEQVAPAQFRALANVLAVRR